MRTQNEPEPTPDTSFRRTPTPTHRLALSSLAGIRREMAKVYSDSRSGSLPTPDGSRLIFMLSKIGELVSECDLEKRIQALEELAEKSTRR